MVLQKWWFCTWHFSCPLFVILNINIRICIHWKQQTAQKRWQSGIHGSAGFTEADFTRFEWIRHIIIYSFQWRNETVWVTGITLKILHWGWLNGRYYLKNKFILGETWQSCDLGIEWDKEGIGENLMGWLVLISSLPTVATVEPLYK